MTKHCRNCVYHMSGDPPACNALHTPIAGDVDCRDWEISSVASSAIAASQAWFNSGGADWIRSIAIRQSQVNQSFGYEIQESIGARNAAIARDTQRRTDEAIARSTHYPIALSELRTATRGIRNPTSSGERWHVALPDKPMLSYSIGLEPLTTSPSFRQITLTTIATPNGLRWQYQGAVIID